MRRGVHLAIGILAFCLYAGVTSRLTGLSYGMLVLGGCTAIAGSLMPDLLERPTSSRHRRFFHSKRALTGSGMVFCVATLLYLLPEVPYRPVMFWISSCALGYLLHLSADAMTKRGLPD